VISVVFSRQDFQFDSYINVFFILKDLKNGVTQSLLLIQDEIKLIVIVYSDIVLFGSYKGSAALGCVTLQSAVHTVAEFPANYQTIMAHC
jgi:hypothetical protein